MARTMDRRTFLAAIAAGTAGAMLPTGLVCGARAEPASPRSPLYATGETLAATSTSREATEAALWALSKGGTAADAYIAAALTQTVVEPGLTTIGGAFGVTCFEARSGKTRSALGRLGPAAAESYDYERFSPVSRTGRGMPVPGFLAGIDLAHRTFGKLPWAQLFEPAVRHAIEGFPVPELILRGATRHGTRLPEGKALWSRDDRTLRPGETLRQPALAMTLAAVAKDGVAAFYGGAFADAYVRRSRADGGKLTRKDMARWSKLTRITDAKPEGNYRGYQVWAPNAGLLTYALHLNEALDLRSSGPARSSPESVYKQVRILEEVFLSTKAYSKNTHAKFTSVAHARRRAKSVLNGPVRDVTIDALFNTCFLVVRDAKGNVAWGTHSINTPNAFGAGILVDGVYAAYAIDRAHVRGTGATARGISTAYALYKDGRPRLVVGSPGFGFVHGPYQYGTSVVEWGLSPIEAARAPRFTLPAKLGSNVTRFESHYNASVFAMLKKRKLPHARIRASGATGLVGALLVQEDGLLHATQDPRRGGLTLAE
jgi:gamma-glutamyltranspeptidase / glutathione hydrolase